MKNLKIKFKTRQMILLRNTTLTSYKKRKMKPLLSVKHSNSTSKMSCLKSNKMMRCRMAWTCSPSLWMSSARKTFPSSSLLSDYYSCSTLQRTSPSFRGTRRGNRLDLSQMWSGTTSKVVFS